MRQLEARDQAWTVLMNTSPHLIRISCTACTAGLSSPLRNRTQYIRTLKVPRSIERAFTRSIFTVTSTSYGTTRWSFASSLLSKSLHYIASSCRRISLTCVSPQAELFNSSDNSRNTRTMNRLTRSRRGMVFVVISTLMPGYA